MSQLSSSPNSHLQLCVNDLLHPTEKSESLLEALTSKQLEEIEKTLHKIKEKKQLSPQQVALPAPITQTANPSTLHHDWTLVAAQIARALANSITTASTNTASSNTMPSIKSEPTTAKPLTSLSTGTASDNKAATPPVVASTIPTAVNSPAPTDATLSTAGPSSPATPTAAAATAASGLLNHEPRTEIRDGVEWVSFVYSHHRVLRRYSIRTDVDQVDLCLLDDQFKSENCVYPRANLPRDDYKGNRWAYETECNTLGWKLAYLNSTEIAGKRGLIQRAVDSYRNRYPSMRSRRVARQEKLMKGTLRKRKQRESEEPTTAEDDDQQGRLLKNIKREETKQDLKFALEKASELPKTVSIDDGQGGAKYRIKINVDSVSLDSIDVAFRRANCVYPRAMEINTSSPFASQRQIEEAKCNELGWKLAWLNPKQLANRKNLLQRVLDVYRSKFLPDLKTRKNSLRMPTPARTSLSIDTDMLKAKPDGTPLTVAALAAQQGEFITDKVVRRGSAEKQDDDESLHSGTTDSLDFHDCFSSHDETFVSPSTLDGSSMSLSSPMNNLMLSAPTSSNQLLFGAQQPQHPLFNNDSCRLSISSGSSGTTDPASSPHRQQHQQQDGTLFKDTAMFELYADPIQLPSAGVDFEQMDYIKTEEDHLMTDPLMSQLFHI